MNPSSEARRAFDDLLDTLREVADRYAGGEYAISTSADEAAAIRAIAHLLESALVGHLEDDPAHPVFRPIVTPTCKVMGDNPDARYFDCAVDAHHVYEITGTVAGAVYTSFTVEEGADGGFPDRIAAVLNDDGFDVAPDGSYRITVGGPPRERNWLPLTPRAFRITTRHYWEGPEPPGLAPVADLRLAIRATDAPAPGGPPDEASIAAGLRRVANNVRSRTLGIPAPGTQDPPAFVSREPHVFPTPVTPGDHALAAADAAYSMAPFLLGPDDALVMTGRWPECRVANVSLWNRFMQTFDYTQRRVSLNRAQTVLEPDGSFRIVVAARDPGVPNWIDTEGQGFGLVFWRFFLPTGPIETPVGRVVPVDSLAD